MYRFISAVRGVPVAIYELDYTANIYIIQQRIGNLNPKTPAFNIKKQKLYK